MGRAHIPVRVVGPCDPRLEVCGPRESKARGGSKVTISEKFYKKITNEN